MLRLQSEIVIGELFFDYVHEAKTISTWKNLTDNCTIKQPRNLKTKDGNTLRDTVKYGGVVSVKSGYQEYELEQIFNGYVTTFKADTAIAEILCEDEMWKLKNGNITKSWADGNVEEILKYLKEETGSSWNYEILGDKINVGQVRFENLTAAKCLQKLKDDFGQVCFFRKGVLIVGKPYEPDASKRLKREFEYGRNVINWKDLEWKSKDEMKLKVKVVNHLPDGTKKEIKVGDDTGEERTLDFYDRSDSDLKSEAEALLEKMKYDGYTGSILAFGEPKVNHGDVAVIKDWRYPEREGEYFIDKVETTQRVASIRQIVSIGPKAN